MNWFALAFKLLPVLQNTAIESILDVVRSKGPGVAMSIAKTEASKYLENGDITMENVKYLLVDELQKIQNSVDAIRNKELQAATFSLNTAYDFNINNNWQEAKKEFAKARERAEMAFGVVKDINKVTAVQIGCLAAAYEFPHNPFSVQIICFSFLKRLYDLPYIKKNYKGLYFDEDHHFQGLTLYAADRRSLIATMTEIYYTNKTISEHLNEFDILKTSNKPFPSLYVTTSKHLNISFDIEHQITHISLCKYGKQDVYLYWQFMCSIYLLITITGCSYYLKTPFPKLVSIFFFLFFLSILGILQCRFILSVTVTNGSLLHRIYLSILQPLFLSVIIYLIEVWMITPLAKLLSKLDEYIINLFINILNIVVLLLMVYFTILIEILNVKKIETSCNCWVNPAEWEAYASTKSKYENEYEDILAPLWNAEL